MELIPKETEEPDFSYDKYSPEFYGSLSETATFFRAHNKAPKKKDRASRFLDATNEAFELIGGAPRLAAWADANYGQFVTKVMTRALPVQAANININSKGPVQIFSAIPPTALDEPIDVTPEKKEDAT